MRVTRRSLPALGGIARSVVLVGGAAAVGQGALVLASPVLARLYTPDAFGLLSVYSALLAILLAVASLRFDLAIPIADDAAEAIHLLMLAVAIALVCCAVVTVALVLWGPALARLTGATALSQYIWLLPIALLAASSAQGIASWAVFERTFPALGRMRAVQGLSQAAFQTALGFLGAGASGLVVGDVLGRVAGTEQLVRPLVAALRATPIRARHMLAAARHHWGFARVMTAASLLNALSLQVPFLLIPALFSLGASGQYFLAYRVLVLPASLVGAGVSQVFFGEASHRRDDRQRLHDLTISMAVTLLVFAIPTYAIVLAAGPHLIAVLFGRQWDAAGLYAQLLAPGLVLWSVASPISTLLLVGRRERESLLFTVGELGLKVVALTLGAVVGSLVVGIVALSASMVAINAGALWRILRVADARLTVLLRPGLAILLKSAPFVAGLAGAVALSPVIAVPAAAIAWSAAVGVTALTTPEVRALLGGSHD